MTKQVWTLYYFPKTCSLASHITLEKVGVNYKAVLVNLDQWEQREEKFLKINPKGRVPVLENASGVLTETPAILQYICQYFPDANLAPLSDHFKLASMNAFNSYLTSTVHVAHAHRVRGYRWADSEAAIAEIARKSPITFRKCFEQMEHDLVEGPWVLGEQLTVADIYLFTVAQWLEGDGVEITDLPKVSQIISRLAEDEDVLKVLASQ